MEYCLICDQIVAIFPGVRKNAIPCHCGAYYHYHHKLVPNCLRCFAMVNIAEFYYQKEVFLHFVLLEMAFAKHDEQNAMVHKLYQSQIIAENLIIRCNNELAKFGICEMESCRGERPLRPRWQCAEFSDHTSDGSDDSCC